MALSNHERVGKALEAVKAGLPAFIERELKSAHGDKWWATVTQVAGPAAQVRGSASAPEWDAAALLKVLWECWNEIFAKTLGRAERSIVSELLEVRNKWAHQKTFNTDDAYRAIDSMQRLVNAVGAREQSEELAKQATELLRIKFDEQARWEKRKTQTTLGFEASVAGVKPWREVVTPHPDVASGKYQLAEFAADLWEVHQGRGSAEYRDPQEFFRRTFLTIGLHDLLVRSVRRLAGEGSDPVVELQTNFGGGKTHSMLALFHLFSGRPVADMPGLEPVMQAAGVPLAKNVKRVVIVGNKVKPGQPDKKDDGTVVRTIWGELAWQLGGKTGYALVKEADETGTNPGDALGKVLRKYSPCLILIDEWVAYARQLHEQSDLPGGSFETQFTFAQTLTEEVKATKGAMLIVSLPASSDGAAGVSPTSNANDEEVGGLRGREALASLRNVVSRVAAAWRPANADESFEIVRRRLFQPMDNSQAKMRDAVAKAYCDLYRDKHQEFPHECGEPDYERKLKSAYPIHPEVFERLYREWSALVKFQRTRGVLRLMAGVIHRLWVDNDRSPLILPASIPLDDPGIQSQMTGYLPSGWETVIESDIDGTDSTPCKLDREKPNLGRYSACRRVARTLFLGSAPTPGASNRGEEDRRIKLGCVHPGEEPAIFGDALRYLAQSATYLYQDSGRYWYATQPTVTKTAEDRAERLKREAEKVAEEIRRRVRDDVNDRGDFAKVHTFSASSGDVPDEMDTRLVVLDVDAPYSKQGTNLALQSAQGILEMRGNSPRLYRNTLVFLAADRTRLEELETAARYYLAWSSICKDSEGEKPRLNLDNFQKAQATSQRDTWNRTADSRIAETYQWLLAPTQPNAQAPVEWQASKVSGADSLAVRAAKKLKNDAQLVTLLHPTALRQELDKVPLWRGDHVSVKQLVEDFARYPYLLRLRNSEVLVESIREGVASVTWKEETFAFAENFDEKKNRYAGLRAGVMVNVSADGFFGFVVKPLVAAQQFENEKPVPVTGGESPKPGVGGGESKPGDTTSKPTPPSPPKRFYGIVTIDAARMNRDASTISQEVVQHLVGLLTAEVDITLEIQVSVPEGVPDNVVRIVSENCRTLKFKSHGFEKE
jgi:predicted AAA+ superfamily ATPase